MLNNFLGFLKLLDRKKKKYFFTLIFFIFFASLFEMLSFSAIFPVILIILEPNKLNEFIGADYLNAPHSVVVIYLLIILMIIFLIKNIISALIYFFQSRFTYNIMSHLSVSLFSKYLDQDYSLYLKNNTSTYLKNTLGEVQNIIDYFVKPVLIMLSESMLLILFFLLLLFLSPLGTLVISFVFLSVFFSFNLIFKKYIMYLGLMRQTHEKLRIQVLQESFSSIKLIKLNKLKKFFLNKFQNSTNKSSYSAGRQDFFLTFPRFVLEYILILGVSIFVIIYLQFNDSTQDIIPKLGMLLIIAFRLLPSVNRLQNCIQSLRYSSTFIENVSNELNDYKYLSNESKKTEITETYELKNIIEFKGVNFWHKEENIILEDINLNIESFSLNLITGISGSGKTTFIDLLMGFHNPIKGSILFDNLNLSDHLTKIQSCIAYVPQNIYLLDGTMKNNIALGVNDDHIDTNLLNQAIELSDLKNFIDINLKGSDLLIGENGNNLSGGQKQRVAIARAIYRKSSILILDEPTSSLDNVTSKYIFDTITKLKSRMTILVISHDEHFKHYFDNVFRIENKKILKI